MSNVQINNKTNKLEKVRKWQGSWCQNSAEMMLNLLSLMDKLGMKIRV